MGHRRSGNVTCFEHPRPQERGGIHVERLRVECVVEGRHAAVGGVTDFTRQRREFHAQRLAIKPAFHREVRDAVGDAFKGRGRIVTGSEGRRIEPSPLRGSIGRAPVADIRRLRRKDNAVHPRTAGIVHREFFSDAAEFERTVQLARFRIFTVAPDQQKAPCTDGHATGEGPFGGVIEVVREVPSAEVQRFCP